MTRDKWKWYGMAGHLCVADSCLFHMLTDVGHYLVSTVGDFRPRYKHADSEKLPEREEFGLNRMFETYVFKQSGEMCDCGCGSPMLADLIDGLSANTGKAARENHMRMCAKWAGRKAAK